MLYPFTIMQLKTAKEKMTYPPRPFGENFNGALAAAKEAMPNEKYWPEPIRFTAEQTCQATYFDIQVYARQIINKLPSMPMGTPMVV